jgi:hypothetical protein
MDQKAFSREYLGRFLRQTKEEEVALRLARQYHLETEAFDRSVCSGPVVDGSVWPSDGRELALVNRHAIQVRRRIIEDGRRQGVGGSLILRAIRSEG